MPVRLAGFGNYLDISWTGTDPAHHLNLEAIATGNNITLPETSIAGPGLANFGGYLDIAWTGTDPAHHLNVEASSGRKVTLPETSIAGPCWPSSTASLPSPGQGPIPVTTSTCLMWHKAQYR